MVILNNKRTAFWAVVSAASLSAAVLWHWKHLEENNNSYQLLNDYESTTNEFVLKSEEVSNQMADSALQELKKRNVKQAIEDCKIAIRILPINANPYILLTKFYLMTKQEQKMFETLTLAGHSFPDFNSIVGVIDDKDLNNIPLDEPQDNIYLASFLENKRMAISFMFDDGQADVYKALPIFEKYGYKATIPVIAGLVSDSSKNLFWGSWAEWRDAANRGFEIANHSMFHRDLKNLYGSDLDISIERSQWIIERNINHEVTSFVFPYDSFSDEAISVALKSHKAVRALKFLRPYYNRTVKIIYGGPFYSVETADRLVDIGIMRRLWLIAECHGVRDKKQDLTFKSITPAFLDKHLSYIHSKTDDVWVDTFSRIFEYLSLRAQTKIEINAISHGSIDFVLLNNDPKVKLSMPLTVVFRIEKGSSPKSAVGMDGHRLKAWTCAADKLCVDVDAYDENVHVQFF